MKFFSCFVKTKIRVFILLITSIFLFSGFLIFSVEYRKAYVLWKADQKDNLKKIRYYYRALTHSVIPQVYISNFSKIDVRKIQMRDIGLISHIYDAKNQLIGNLSREKRSLIGLQDIASNFLDVLIFLEDRRFYEHSGVDYLGILRAMKNNILSMRLVEGGSTITQQLAKLLFTNRQKTFQRKIYETLVALDIEKYYDKNSILLMYINYIYFGFNINGIEEAAQFYFSKSAKNLEFFESVFLVAMIPNPTLYSPFKFSEHLKKRHWQLLNVLFEAGFMDYDRNRLKDFYDQFWKKHTFNASSINKIKKEEKTSHTISYVVEEVRKRLIIFLKSQFQNDQEQAEHFLYTQGLKIFTSIEMDIQKQAEILMKKHLERYRNLLYEKKIIKKDQLSKVQGALISIDPKTGHIKAMVGGYEFSQDNQYNRAFQAKRQPGSIFKPIFYLGILDDQLLSPYSLELDVYKPIPMDNGEFWNVKNYGERYLNRPITLTQAIKISSNQVIARLVQKVSLRKTKDVLMKTLNIPFKTIEELYPDYQYSTVLGTVLLSPLELAQIYMMIVNQGKKVDPKIILRIYDLAGDLIDYEEQDVLRASPSIQVVSKEASYQVIKMLKEVLQAGGTAASIRNDLSFSDFAVKTGTSQESRDLWMIGLNPSLVTVLWIGHDMNLPLYGASGSFLAPVFRDYVKSIKEYVKFENFELDASYHFHREKVCRISGLIAKDTCPDIDPEALFIIGSKTEPDDYCQLNHKASWEEIGDTLNFYLEHGFFPEKQSQNSSLLKEGKKEKESSEDKASEKEELKKLPLELERSLQP